MSIDDLTISVFHGIHDSCATFANDHSILLHLEAERITRCKHAGLDVAGMEKLIQTGLEYLNVDEGSIDTVLVAALNDPLRGGKRSIGAREFKVIPTAHHANHIGSVQGLFTAPALIVCADGGSEEGTSRLYMQHETGVLQFLEDLDNTPLNGRFYGTLTQLVIDDDFLKAYVHYPGKTMGLAAYGHNDIALRSWIEKHWHWFNVYYGTQNELAFLQQALGLSTDYSKPWLDQQRCDLACTAQQFWIDGFLDRIACHAQSCGTIALTGGCALNVVLNTAIAESGLFDQIVVSPASSDSGQSLGAVLWHNQNIVCTDAFLGRGNPPLSTCPPQLIEDLLAGFLVGWFEGRSEIGPRALGHRSILALPTPHRQKDRINKIKGREPYRPVAPIIRLSDLNRFFFTSTPSPYMSFAPVARAETRQIAPAIVHRDGTSRLQTITPATHPALHAALDALDSAIGTPILCNTSFNFNGEPIVDTVEDAHRHFAKSTLDVLYIDGERFAS